MFLFVLKSFLMLACLSAILEFDLESGLKTEGFSLMLTCR
jgi:hypothetical protein